MIRRSLFLFPLLLAGCAAGGQGPDGAPGIDERACTAVESGGSWQIDCPDGSSATVAPGSCEESVQTDGSRLIRCGDGTEAVVRAAESIGSGAIAGKAVLEGHGAIAGIRVEVLGTGLSFETAADGSFRFEEVPAGNWDIEATFEPYQPAVITGIKVLPGTSHAGTLVLGLHTDFSWLDRYGSSLFSSEGQAILLQANPLMIVDLVTGDLHTFEIYASSVRWTPEGILSFSDATTVGFWSRDLGLQRATGTAIARADSAAVLALREEIPGEEELFVFRPDGETLLGGLMHPWPVWRHSFHPIWVFVGAEGTFVVDALAEVPVMHHLQTERATSFGGDSAGTILWIETAGERLHFDLRTGAAIPVPDGAVVKLQAGLVCWVDGTGYHCHDARSGGRIDVADVAVVQWNTSHSWFWYEDAGSYLLHPRAGGTPLVLVDEPGQFSPSRRHLATITTGGTLRLIDLESGATTGVDIVPDTYRWASDAAIVAMAGTEAWIVTPSGRTVEAAGEFLDAAGDYLVMENANRMLWLWEMTTLTSWPLGQRGRSGYPQFNPDGTSLVWRDDGGMLWARNLATGSNRRIGNTVGEYYALSDVILFKAASIAGVAGTATAPYP